MPDSNGEKISNLEQIQDSEIQLDALLYIIKIGGTNVSKKMGIIYFVNQ